MSPVTQSQNPLAANNQQPTYSVLWHPYAIDPALEAAIAVGTLMQMETPYELVPAGDGSYVPLLVEPSQAAATGLLAGVFIGSSSLGTPAPVPDSIAGTSPSLIAMCAVSGVVQVLVDNDTTAGHTLNVSATTDGCAHDSGGTALTTATLSTIGVALEPVTFVSTPVLCWVKLGVPF